MMNQHCSCIVHLVVFAFSSPVFSLNVDEMKSVEIFYQKDASSILEYYQLIKNSNKNPCVEESHKIHELINMTYAEIEKVVIFAEGTAFSISLDDSKFFNVPAIVKCNPQSNDINSIFDYFLIIEDIEENTKKFKFLRVYEDVLESQPNVFITQEILKIRIIKITYTGRNLQIMTKWYKKNRNKLHHTALCYKLRLVTEFPKPKSFNIQEGQLLIGNYAIFLGQGETVIRIPATMLCKIKYKNENRYDKLYYVAGYFEESWYQIYEIQNTTNYERVFTIQQDR